MKKFIKLKKAVVFMLLMAMLISIMPMEAHAIDYNNINNTQEFSIKRINNKTVLVDSKDGSELVTIKEYRNFKKIIIKNTTTGKEEHLIVNKANGSIYSTITGKTVIPTNNAKENIIPVSKTSYTNKWISYAYMRDVIGKTSTAGKIVGLLLTLVPGASVAGKIIRGISSILRVSNYFIPNTSKHGMKFRVKTVRYYRSRMGKRRVWRSTRTILSVSRY